VGLRPLAARIFEKFQEEDGGGDFRDQWIPQAERVRGRIDALRTRGQNQMFGEAIDESTTHIISLDPNAIVTVKDRIEIEGIMWTITSEAFFTDEATIRLQVKELVA
jgi:hypothetical protein